jgi:hypothetical protein
VSGASSLETSPDMVISYLLRNSVYLFSFALLGREKGQKHHRRIAHGPLRSAF